MSDFKAYVALVTPFTEDNLIDFNALKNLVMRLIKQGCNGFIVLGTTAETTSLTLDERVMIIRFVRGIIPRSIPMIVGVGTNNLEDTIRNCRIASELGADGVLIVTPYYICPNQKGLYAYFDSIASYCLLPIYLYNVKRRCGVELESWTIERLLKKHSHILGLKQACGNYKNYISLKEKYPRFQLFSGDDGNLEEALTLKLDGLISVIGNARLDCLMNVIEENKNVNIWNEMSTFFYVEPTPAPTKYVLSKQGIGTDMVRLPLCKVSDELKMVLDKYIK